MHDVFMGHVAIGKHHLVDLSGPAQCLQLGFVDDRHAIGVELARELRRIMAPGNPRDLSRCERDNFDRWIVAIDDVKVMKVAACGSQDHDTPPLSPSFHNGSRAQSRIGIGAGHWVTRSTLLGARHQAGRRPILDRRPGGRGIRPR